MRIRHSPSEILARAPRAPGLRPDRFRVDRKVGQVRIDVPVRREWYRILLSVVWLCLLVAFQAGLVVLLVGGAPREMAPGLLTKTALGALLGLSLAGGVLLVWRILWYLGGRVEFTIDEASLIIRRFIGPVPLGTRKFPRDRVRNPRATPLRYRIFYPVWGRSFVNHEEHQLSFDVDRWTHHAARGLTESEAEYLAGLLREGLLVEGHLRQAS